MARIRQPGRSLASARDGAGAGAEVGDVGRAGVHQRECALHQQLGLGARHQDVRRDCERQRPEVAASREVGEGFTRCAAPDERRETGCLRGLHRVVGLRKQSAAADAQRLGQQQFGIELRRAAAAEARCGRAQQRGDRRARRGRATHRGLLDWPSVIEWSFA